MTLKVASNFSATLWRNCTWLKQKQARQKRLSTHCWFLDYLRKWLGDKLEEMQPCMLANIHWLARRYRRKT